MRRLVPADFYRAPQKERATFARFVGGAYGFYALVAIGVCVTTWADTISVMKEARASQQQTKPSILCTSRDIELITFMELRGEAQDLPAENLVKARFTQLDARRECLQGHLTQAVELYNRAIEALLRDEM